MTDTMLRRIFFKRKNTSVAFFIDDVLKYTCRREHVHYIEISCCNRQAANNDANICSAILCSAIGSFSF